MVESGIRLFRANFLQKTPATAHPGDQNFPPPPATGNFLPADVVIAGSSAYCLMVACKVRRVITLPR
jgi:hypothetical protein